MKTFNVIRELIREALVKTTDEYMKKESVRQEIYLMLLDNVKNGKITNQEELNDYFKTVDMSVKALKMVPFDAYKSIIDSKKV
jgi:hypothetical protein